MKWMHVLAIFAASWTTACWAEMPQYFGTQPMPLSGMMSSGITSGQNWWARYGEPVNLTALNQPAPAKGDIYSAPAPAPMYGPGYYFGPGSCDCPAPCVLGLWAGYYQNPHRCNPHGGCLHGHCGGGMFGGGCGMCGRGACGSCGSGCGAAPACGCGSAPASTVNKQAYIPPTPLPEEATLYPYSQLR